MVKICKEKVWERRLEKTKNLDENDHNSEFAWDLIVVETES